MSVSLLNYGKRKVGDFVYPVDNGSCKFFDNDRWDLVISVDSDENVTGVKCFHNYEAVRVLETIMKYPELVGLKKNER